jgi:hypothetical protein
MSSCNPFSFLAWCLLLRLEAIVPLSPSPSGIAVQGKVCFEVNGSKHGPRRYFGRSGRLEGSGSGPERRRTVEKLECAVKDSDECWTKTEAKGQSRCSRRGQEPQMDGQQQ